MSGSEHIVPFDHPFFQMERPAWSRSRSYNAWDMSDPWADHPFMAMPSSRIWDQNFGMALQEDDLFPATPYRGWYLRPRRVAASPAAVPTSPVPGLFPGGPLQTQAPSGVSEVENKSDEFRVNLDVTHFKPGEIVVKATGNRLVIHGKHEERPDDHGFIQREFRRSYLIPKGVDADAVKSSLSADGVLSITAPKTIEGTTERNIPITMDTTPKLQA